MQKALTYMLLLISFHAFAQQTSPVEGDDLLKLLGLRKNSAMVEKLNDFIGNKELKEDISFLNYGKGIQINFERSVVTGIDLYNGDNPYSSEFKRFPGSLPKGLSFENTIHQAKEAMGEGFETEGEVTGTYMLMKTFHLNDNDDYKMSIEFYSGRMNMVSLVYIEGGSGEGEAKSESGEKVFSGNDFFVMMKKNQYNLEYTRFLEQLQKPSFHDRNKRIYIEDGVQVNFNKSGLIERITLYAGGQRSDYKGETYKAYTNLLPFGIRMTNNKSAIVQKAGPPLEDNGGSFSYKEGYCKLTIYMRGDKIDQLKFELDQQPGDIPVSNVKGRKIAQD